jgi:hypothetical protein
MALKYSQKHDIFHFFVKKTLVWSRSLSYTRIGDLFNFVSMRHGLSSVLCTFLFFVCKQCAVFFSKTHCMHDSNLLHNLLFNRVYWYYKYTHNHNNISIHAYIFDSQPTIYNVCFHYISLVWSIFNFVCMFCLYALFYFPYASSLL